MTRFLVRFQRELGHTDGRFIVPALSKLDHYTAVVSWSPTTAIETIEARYPGAHSIVVLGVLVSPITQE
jgi:hypothetical protein